MDPQQAKEQEEKLKKTINGAQETLSKAMDGISKITDLFHPIASKKVITANGTATASVLKNNMVKIDFASEQDAKSFYESLKEFNG